MGTVGSKEGECEVYVGQSFRTLSGSLVDVVIGEGGSGRGGRW